MAAYPPPSDRWLPIFDVLSFRPATSSASGGGGGGGDYLTQAEANRLYLQYPIAQGNITLTSVQVDNAAQFEARANFNSALHAYQGVTYSNGTVQTTASNALVPSTTFQNTTVTTDAYGAIVSLANGGVSGNFVTTDTIQSITAAKTFTQTVIADQGIAFLNGSTQSTAMNTLAASSTYTNATVTTDVNGAIIALANGSSTGGGVTLDTAQTITGQKTFTQTILGTCSNATFAAAASTVATTPQAAGTPMYLTAGDLGSTAGNSTLQSTAATITSVGSITALGLYANGGIAANNGAKLTFYNSGSTTSTTMQQTTFSGTPSLSILANTGSPSGSLFYLQQSTGSVPAPQPTAAVAVGGTVISWNNVTEFLNCSGTSTAGGFTFSALSSTQNTQLIAKLVRGVFSPNDASNQLATNAWVQSAITAAIVPIVSTTKTQYYYNLAAASTYTFALQETILITGLAVGNFFTSTYVPNNNFITVRYTYQTFSADLSTVYSSTGVLMLFPQRIAGQIPDTTGPDFFGYPPSKDYNICNIAGRPPAVSSAFNQTPTIPYWNSTPAGGLNSGYVDIPNTLYMTGSADGTGATYGFSIFQPLAGVGWTVSFELEVMTNPFPASVGVSLKPSVLAP